MRGPRAMDRRNQRAQHILNYAFGANCSNLMYCKYNGVQRSTVDKSELGVQQGSQDKILNRGPSTTADQGENPCLTGRGGAPTYFKLQMFKLKAMSQYVLKNQFKKRIIDEYILKGPCVYLKKKQLFKPGQNLSGRRGISFSAAKTTKSNLF